MPIVEFKDVSRVYQSGDHDTKALGHVSFTLDEGKFVVILGPSGAGKSTLLNLLGGLDSPTDGKIMVQGHDISTLSSDDLAAYRAATVGFVFQFYNLIPNLTALENVELASQIVRDSLPAPQVLTDVGLGERMRNFPAQLSGGEQQRVAIARALVNNPYTIIADEPTGNLDPARSLEIMMLLERINQLGTTVLVVTHEKDLVNKFQKRVITLERGIVVSDGIGYNMR